MVDTKMEITIYGRRRKLDSKLQVNPRPLSQTPMLAGTLWCVSFGVKPGVQALLTYVVIEILKTIPFLPSCLIHGEKVIVCATTQGPLIISRTCLGHVR